MAPDKYTATWVSHSSISDFLKCPRSYFLRNVYKDPRTGHKMTIVSPPLSLGQVVHEVIESLAVLPADERLKISLVKKLDPIWLKISGKKGGFKTHSEEMTYKERAEQMLINLQEDPGPLLRKAIKIKSGINLPNYFLSEEENIILCGKIDWLEYEEKSDSVRIIDFKTGKNEEPEDSLQLPIYLLLATNTQSKKVSGVSYWYLDRDDGLTEKKLPDMEKSFGKVYSVARRIKLARQINHFKCPKGGCFSCRPYERILKGGGEKVGVSDTRQDVYILTD
ncbi:MAG: PD-(D/E)XK nuclease family protein [Candidatus Woesebacteria bacterium]|nr:PD-(D/E)XK nuclease family protein [Candidatus Woesebacteria bacterium]